jgi:hypothetical protein
LCVPPEAAVDAVDAAVSRLRNVLAARIGVRGTRYFVA